MSPPDTNLKTQKRRHRPVLLTLLAGLVFLVAAGAIYTNLVDDPDLPGPTESGVSDGTGDETSG
jgi:hypothetical protein